MKIYQAHNYGTLRSSNEERPMTKLPSDLRGASLLVSDLCKWNDPELVDALRNLKKVSIAEGVKFEKTLVSDDMLDEPLLVSLLRHCRQDEVLSMLHANLENGWPIPGKVKRTENSLKIFKEAKDESWGYETFGKGCVYIGDFLGDKHHGKGRLYYSIDWCYEGDFFDNQKHGHGVDEWKASCGHRWEGIFTFDEFRGNPRKSEPKKNVGWKVIFGLKS